MASATLSPKYDASSGYTFDLVTTGTDRTTWKVSGRDIAVPQSLEIIRKFTAPNALANDHVQVRIARSERNTSTGKPATCQVLLDISVPKDALVITQAEQRKLVSILGSLLSDNAAVASSANALKLVGGFDL